MNYDRQMKAWALDRALETLKAKGTEINPTEVITVGEQYCAWVLESPAEEDVQETESTEH